MNELAHKQGVDGKLRELALFAGAGGGILGGKLLGWNTVCAVEWEPYAASVLIARQNDGILSPFPIWDDVQTFDGRPWRGLVDVVSGGFPCQDISSAGRGAGIDGKRSGMWAHMARIIGEVRPRFVFVENSPMLTSRGLGRVLGDLAALGYNARWGVLGAVHAGAPHKRDRIWIRAELADTAQLQRNGRNDHTRIGMECGPQSEPRNDSRAQDVANASSGRRRGTRSWEVEQPWRAKTERTSKNLAYADSAQRQRTRQSSGGNQEHANAMFASSWWRHDPAEIPESGVGRMAHGVAARVDRLKAIGNGQVPSVVRLAWQTLGLE